MDAPTDLDRRVTQVENETVHIYDLIEERAAEVRLRFSEVDRRFDGVDQRFDGVDQRLDSMDQRFDAVNATLREHGDTLAEILRRLPEPN